MELHGLFLYFRGLDSLVFVLKFLFGLGELGGFLIASCERSRVLFLLGFGLWLRHFGEEICEALGENHEYDYFSDN